MTQTDLVAELEFERRQSHHLAGELQRLRAARSAVVAGTVLVVACVFGLVFALVAALRAADRAELDRDVLEAQVSCTSELSAASDAALADNAIAQDDLLVALTAKQPVDEAMSAIASARDTLAKVADLRAQTVERCAGPAS